MRPIRPAKGFAAAPATLVLFAGMAAGAAETLQIDVRPILNARPVTVVAGGKLVSWTEGLDGDYSGLATMAAAKIIGDAVPKALPDDGRFPATDKHPEVVLHFANEDAAGKQVRRSMGADTFTVAVPPGRYSRLAVFCMSANGPSSLSVQLRYADGSETRSLTVPDWFNPLPAGDAARFHLAYDLAKWDKANRKTEPDHHFLYGLELTPAELKSLLSFKVSKTNAGALTFWGATGVRTQTATRILDPRAAVAADGKARGLRLLPDADALGRRGRKHAFGARVPGTGSLAGNCLE